MMNSKTAFTTTVETLLFSAVSASAASHLTTQEIREAAFKFLTDEGVWSLIEKIKNDPRAIMSQKALDIVRDHMARFKGSQH